MMGKPILCLDFDGVCHSYTSGWINAWTIPDPPVPGLFEFLEEALKHFRVAIYSSRSAYIEGVVAMEQWFRHHAGIYYFERVHSNTLTRKLVAELEFPTTKPPAMVTLDDRAVTFTGVWPDVALLKQFQPWTKWSGLNEVKE